MLTFIPYHAVGTASNRERNMFQGQDPQATMSFSKVPPKSSNSPGRYMRVRMEKFGMVNTVNVEKMLFVKTVKTRKKTGITTSVRLTGETGYKLETSRSQRQKENDSTDVLCNII
jgi:hypothetical protein